MDLDDLQPLTGAASTNPEAASCFFLKIKNLKFNAIMFIEMCSEQDWSSIMYNMLRRIRYERYDVIKIKMSLITYMVSYYQINGFLIRNLNLSLISTDHIFNQNDAM